MQTISRRQFLTAGAGAMGLAGLSAAPLVAGCAHVPFTDMQSPRIEHLLAEGPRVMWVAAHPDDEIFAGSLLLTSVYKHHNPLYMLILTRGDGGECCLPEGCNPDLATVRSEEMRRAAWLYRATLQHERYFNAPLPVESFPKRHELAAIWAKQKDPADLIAAAIRQYKPDVVFTLAPVNGFTGHPEHQAASRFTTAAIRLAADAGSRVGGQPAHRVAHTFYCLNKNWLFRLIGKDDPGPVSEKWNAQQLLHNGYRARELMSLYAQVHRSQAADMKMTRQFGFVFDHVWLQRTDPFAEILDPYEPVV